MRTIAFALLATILTGNSVALAASTIPSFVATCDAKVTHTVRTVTDLTGKTMMTDEWTTNEKFQFPGPHFETFKYTRGQDFILIQTNNKRLPIVGYHDGGIVVTDAYVGEGQAFSVWTFAINLTLRRIIATQVNSWTNFGNGVKGRVVQLDCVFEF
jgi:hypothetical protein